MGQGRIHSTDFRFLCMWNFLHINNDFCSPGSCNSNPCPHALTKWIGILITYCRKYILASSAFYMHHNGSSLTRCDQWWRYRSYHTNSNKITRANNYTSLLLYTTPNSVCIITNIYLINILQLKNFKQILKLLIYSRLSVFQRFLLH